MPQGFTFDLTGRIVMVTGASSGVGKRFAEILAESGARVVITGRRLPLLQEIQSSIEAKGGTVLAVPMDVADESSTIAAFDAAEQAFGRVDSVVANAGINVAGSALGIPIEDFDRTVAINLRGVFLTAREGARRMIAAGSSETGRGRIVIMSSITGHHPSAGVAPYSATKAAVAQLGRALAKDWATKGINVNVIAPGYMLTEMTGDLWSVDRGKKLLASFARQRVMNVDVLDAMLLYLCSDASAQVTGSVFTIDDGQTL